MFTDTELQALLSHPDSQVRSLADWTREYTGNGWRGLRRDVIAADDCAFRLHARLQTLKAQS